jgi:hypothetical protein
VGDRLTSALDFIALLLIATALFWLIGGGWGLLAAGAFLLVSSFVASALSAARTPRSDE